MPLWTNNNVTVVPAPIYGAGSANRMLGEYYKNSPTALDLHRELTPQELKELGDATWYNRIATGADAPKK